MNKVLVIDDEPFILMMIEETLKRAGMQVVTLNRSVDAHQVARSEQPDLIILDWMMPEVSGIEVCRAIRKDPDIATIPIFMLTAKGQEEDQQLGIKSGVTRYITKPFSPKALLRTVQEFLGTTG
jgi:DNA-binding response OmpR family regulator